MAMRRGKGKKADEVVKAVGKGLKAVGKKTARSVTRRNPSMAKQIADKGLKTSIKTPAKSKSSTAFKRLPKKQRLILQNPMLLLHAHRKQKKTIIVFFAIREVRFVVLK
jgi:hypothetical protein